MNRSSAMAQNFALLYGRRTGKSIFAQEVARTLRELALRFQSRFKVLDGWVEVETRGGFAEVQARVSVTLDRSRHGVRTQLDLSPAEAEKLVGELQRALAHLAVAEVHET